MVTKRLVDIDDELLTEARRILDSATIKETVNGALGEVVKAELRRRYLDLLASGRLDLNNPEVMKGAWR